MSKVFYEKREDIEEKYKWNLDLMYDNLDDWQKDLDKAMDLAKSLSAYKGKLGESSDNLLALLKNLDDMSRLVSKAYSYANMRLDQDTRSAKSQELKDKALKTYVAIDGKTSFVTPEILAIDEEKIKEFLEENEELKLYEHHLDGMFRFKKHVLSAKEENLLAQMGEFSGASQQTFSMLDNADIKFPKVKNEEGEEVRITHGNFIPFQQSDNRELRKEVFEKYYKVYDNFKNTYAQTLSGNINKNIFNARVRNYDSALHASLESNFIDTKVYDNLIESINDNLDAMHKYMEIRKRALGVEELEMYDIYTPIVKDYKFDIDYEDGVDLILKGLEPLGKEYVSLAEKGFNSRWIDVYENTGKRSGAYSGGCYDSYPYILLNYQNDLGSVFTTAHEMGHSMHSYFTRENQPPVYGSYSIFVAEVASTTNEALLLDYMLNNVDSKEEKLYLLNHYLEQFRSTVFRQTMFAEFEKEIYEYAEKGGSLTADYLSETYGKLNKKYYGPAMNTGPEISLEWARIPHFYYNFYVYQYATGYSAAVSLSQQILEEGDKAVERYLDFLKSGSSDYPINVLKKAGVDMTSKEPVDKALAIFRKLVDEMDKLI